MLQFKKYINANSEKMRHLFVSHEGKKELTVTTWNDSEESQWEEFFTLMIKAIESNTNEDVVNNLQADFTTTSIVEKMLSTAVIMDSFKNYFDYGRCIPCCGIRYVLFMGTLDDWLKLQDKLDKIKTYSVDNFWTRYIDELKPIIKQFINTYQGNVDFDFWDKIMNIRYGSIGSGSTSYVSGWILKFYGLYKEVDSDEIKEELIDVPVKIDNKLTGTIKNVSIFGGFGGVTREVGDYEVKSKTQILLNPSNLSNLSISTPETKTESNIWSFFNILNWINNKTTNSPITNSPITNSPITNSPITNSPITNSPIINFQTITYDAYRPQMSFIIYHDGNEKKLFEC
jgi:hypothetical protein